MLQPMCLGKGITEMFIIIFVLFFIIINLMKSTAVPIEQFLEECKGKMQVNDGEIVDGQTTHYANQVKHHNVLKWLKH